MKRIISIFLSLICIITALPLSVAAKENDGFIITEEGCLPFKDVTSGAWYTDAVEFCYVNDIVKGMDEYTFATNGKLTRAQFVFMLANAEGVDLSEYTTTRFSDVKQSYWFSGAVAWAYESGIVSGTSETSFSPSMTITREQLSIIMWLYMKDRYPAESEGAAESFNDKYQVSDWAIDGMEYAIKQGLISGMGEGILQPRGTVTRAQVSRILMIYLKDWLYGSKCDHSSVSEPTCTQRPVCTCTLTFGLALGHQCEILTCTEGSNCQRCGEYIAPEPEFHTFLPATCTERETCIYCENTRGTALGHDFTERTCQMPKTCRRCRITEGTVSGHKIPISEGGQCEYCGGYFFFEDKVRRRYFISMKGLNGDIGSYIQYVDMPAEDEIRITTLSLKGDFRMETDIIYADGTVINCYLSDIRFEWRQNSYNAIQTITFADGYDYMNFVHLTPDKYTYDTVLAVPLHDLDHSLSYRQETAYRGVTRYMITVCNIMLKELYEGGSVRDLGFTSFY